MFNIISLVLGILGSVGGILWLYEFYHKKIKKISFNLLFPVKKEEKIILVVPSGGKCIDKDFASNLPEDKYPNIITTIEDSMAKTSIFKTFIENHLQPDIRLHTELSKADKAGHLFIICGPAGNTVAKELLFDSGISIPFTFSREKNWKIVDNEKLQVHPDADMINRDHAIIMKIKNPWSVAESRTYIYLAAGIEGLGTWGAAYTMCEKSSNITRYLKAQCKVSKKSCFVGVVSVRRNHNNQPMTNILLLNPL